MPDLNAEAVRIGKSIDDMLHGERQGDIMEAIGYILASMSLHQGAHFLDETMATVRGAADDYFATYRANALS